MKTNASSLSFNSQPPYMEYLAPLPPPQFYKEILISSSMIFQKSNKVGLCALWRLMVQKICNTTNTQKSSTNWRSSSNKH